MPAWQLIRQDLMDTMHFFSSAFIKEAFASIYVNVYMPMPKSEAVCYCK